MIGDTIDDGFQLAVRSEGTHVQFHPVGPAEIHDVVALHVAAFAGFYLTALGPGFLKQYYRKVIEYPGGLCLGAFDGAQLLGAVAGFINPPKFYASLRADRLQLAFTALPALAADPRKAARFLRNYRSAGIAARLHSREATAELASLGVHPTFAGRGIGERLVRLFISEARECGALTVTLTTDANENDAVNHFYQKLGFHLERHFEPQPGRVLNEYCINTVPGKLDDAS